eukprot:762941-Hanusia_phi.AAC.1
MRGGRGGVGEGRREGGRMEEGGPPTPPSCSCPRSSDESTRGGKRDLRAGGDGSYPGADGVDEEDYRGNAQDKIQLLPVKRSSWRQLISVLLLLFLLLPPAHLDPRHI